MNNMMGMLSAGACAFVMVAVISQNIGMQSRIERLTREVAESETTENHLRQVLDKVELEGNEKLTVSLVRLMLEQYPKDAASSVDETQDSSTPSIPVAEETQPKI